MGSCGRIITIISLCLSLLAMTGCRSSAWNYAPPPSPTAAGGMIGATGGALIGSVATAGAFVPAAIAVGGLLSGAWGNIIQAHQDLIERLLYNGVQVIRVGDDVALILPSDRFFYPGSANFNPRYIPVLRDIATLLRSIDKIAVRISAHTDASPYVSWRQNLSLSRLQANKMRCFLWGAGIDTRLLYSVGYGQEDPIATNATALGRAANRRIVITLRKIPSESND